MISKKYFLKKYKQINKFLQKKTKVFNHKKTFRKRYQKTGLIVVAVLIVLSTALFSFDVFSQEANTAVLDMSLSVDNYDSTTKTFTDRSGSNNNGVSNNNAVFESGRYGSVDGTMSFNGVSDYVEVPDDSSLNPSDGSFTISFWIKVPDWDGSHQNVIIKSSGAGANYRFSLSSGWDGNCIFWFQDDRVYGNQYVYAGFDATDGDWHHIVGLIDREAEEFRSYSDGDYYNRRPFSNFDGYLNNITNSAPLNFGNAEFEGLIEDVRIYNYALTDQEVQDMYESEKVNYSASSLQKGLVGHWTMDGVDYNSSTNRLTDKTPYSNHGTNNGATFSTDRMGESDGAMSFDGVSDYVRTDNINYNINNGDWTASAWYYVDKDVLDGNFETVFGFGQQYLNGFHMFENRICSRAPDGSNYFCLNYASGLEPKKWQLVTVTHDLSSKKITSYINGQMYDSVTYTGTLVSSLNRPIIFGWRGTSDDYFNGSIDDVRIYNRVLSELEIQSLYDLYEPKISAGSLNKGLIFDMPLTLKHTKDETAGSEVMTDKTPYSNDGQNYGATIIDEGASFDGINDKILHPNIFFDDKEEYSYSVWIKWTKENSPDRFYLPFGDGGGGGSTIYFTSSDGTPYFRYRNINGVHVFNDGSNLLNEIFDGYWHNITWTVDFEGKISIFVDGELKREETIDSGESSAFLYNGIGDGYVGDSYLWNGSISNLRIYNRTLSETEVQSLYDQGANNVDMTAHPE
ncbi:MAG TPA: LamG domain-containing protein [Patescibacteria group bacterium]|nr:LamG domain-containing protein [Patescibacteria group bacterium]